MKDNFYKPKKGDTIRIMDYPDRLFPTEHYTHKQRIPECEICTKGFPVYDLKISRCGKDIIIKKVVRIKHRIQALEID